MIIHNSWTFQKLYSKDWPSNESLKRISQRIASFFNGLSNNSKPLQRYGLIKKFVLLKSLFYLWEYMVVIFYMQHNLFFDIIYYVSEQKIIYQGSFGMLWKYSAIKVSLLIQLDIYQGWACSNNTLKYLCDSQLDYPI